MAVYVGTKSHFQSLANNCSSNRRVSFVNLYFLISHFPQHKEEEGWKTVYGLSDLAALRSRSWRRANHAEHVHNHGATCGAWWAPILRATCSGHVLLVAGLLPRPTRHTQPPNPVRHEASSIVLRVALGKVMEQEGRQMLPSSCTA